MTPGTYFTDDIGDAVGTARAMATGKSWFRTRRDWRTKRLLDDMVHDAAQDVRLG